MKRLKWCCRENAAGALYMIILDEVYWCRESSSQKQALVQVEHRSLHAVLLDVPFESHLSPLRCIHAHTSLLSWISPVSSHVVSFSTKLQSSPFSVATPVWTSFSSVVFLEPAASFRHSPCFQKRRKTLWKWLYRKRQAALILSPLTTHGQQKTCAYIYFIDYEHGTSYALEPKIRY